LYRAEIKRLLASAEFASSRQLQEFLRYISERAFEGVTHLDQADIAAAVLGRRADFDPMEDATVRKLASVARQRLEQHYSREGNNADVVVTLPLRSYVPHFEHRLSMQPAVAPRPPWPLILIAAAVAVLLSAGFLLYRRHSGTEAANGAIVIRTAKGDIITRGADIEPSAVQLGPVLAAVDEVTARVDFTPRQEAQQAGVIVWQDGDNYIRLGRRFFGRNQIDYSMEVGGVVAPHPQAFYDPEGQSGAPIWLSIRRQGEVYRGYISRDGIRWDPAGEAVTPGVPFRAPRAGIYAMNGRRDAPQAAATFTHFATGVTFDENSVDLLRTLSQWGWAMSGTCADTLRPAIERFYLLLDPGAKSPPCNWEFSHPLAGRDWEITTKLDFLPMPGVSAGLVVHGAKGAVRMARYSLNGPAISFIHDGKELVGDPDLNGSPALLLRLAARDGWLSGSFSADGEHFQSLRARVRPDELGDKLRAGLRMSQSAVVENGSPAARFYYYREVVGRLVPWR
jgi:hypothetical protein